MIPHRMNCGDCLDPVAGLASLEDRSIDHAITDPPYTAHVHGLQRRLTRNGVKASELDFAPMTDETMGAVALELARVTRRWVVIFCAAEQIGDWKRALIAAGLEYIRTGAWVKTVYLPQLTGDRPAAGFEALVLAHQPGRKRWNGGGRSAIWQGPPKDPGPRWHDTQKPAWLMEALIRDFTEPGELILDPYAGSGTTGAVAKRLGRRFVGWELDPKYHAIAERRIRDAREQIQIEAVTPKPKQESML